jgi:hypothetical protein
MSVSTVVKSWFKIFRKKPLAVVVAPAVMTVKLPAVEPKIFNEETDAEIKEKEIWEKKCTDRRIRAAEIHKDIANGYLSVDGTRVNLKYGLFECFNIINYGVNEKEYCGGWIERHSIQNLEIRKSEICINEYLTENDMVRMLYGWGRISLKVQDLKAGDESRIIGFAFSKEAIIEGLRKVRDKSPKIWERLLEDDMDGPICDEILQYIVYGDVFWN